MWRSRIRIFSLILLLLALLSGCASTPTTSGGGGSSTGIAVGLTALAKQDGFDPSVNAPLPSHRIIAAYGIACAPPSLDYSQCGDQTVSFVDPSGQASTPDWLKLYLPTLQNLAQQYQTLDPTHPTIMAVDLVVNVIKYCSDPVANQWCTAWIDDSAIQPYIQFCQQHNMLLFLDLQLGTEPVSDAVTKYVQKYLTKYPFVELALDTEFHFPNTPQGHADAAGYPCCLGWMDASEVNWAIDDLAKIEYQYHLPRKVLIVHQWNTAVLPDKDSIERNPNVSVVLQSDGFGFTSNKLGDYWAFEQNDMIGYGGYKLFYTYPSGSDCNPGPLQTCDQPLQSPADILSIFPQPLFISYQ